ncbi:serine protease [Streptomyces sp. UNOC14_S4]|uniref:trypsin-like serine peptidase n=1 Tax=Streptomyces sp. UNOC14_S4 TaxID=2872340 RepID=UPI001E3A5A27|nr:serine protease [Streptomyces sp. UNOC14_S4]MCC3766394.1 serine protease [Streptomyces sp. UNOC14_S4]
MRLKVSGTGPAVIAALVATVLVLGGIALALGGHGPAPDSPVAEGDAAGHYTQPREQADAAAKALLAAVRSEPAPAAPGTRAVRSDRTDPLPASEPLEASDAKPSPAVGPLFYTGQGTPGHGCTASVVHSPKGDLVITAAHCVHQDGFRTDIAFAPGYHDGVAPYGVWVPTSIDIDPEWAEDRDPDHDVAFLRVRRLGDSTPVEQVTGAEKLGLKPTAGKAARLIGYPADRDTPVACQNTTAMRGATQLRFDCRGLTNGTSGGPVLTDVDPATGLGTVNGVVGGYQEGGDDDTSYSSYFGDAVAALYKRATTSS